MMIPAFGPERAAQLARQHLEWGVKCLKVKVGLDPDGDEARVRAVREEAGPEVPVGVDANCGWSFTTARRMIDRLAPYDLLFMEQPIRPGDADALAALRAESPIPIMADESVFTLADAWSVTRAGAADILSIYPGKNGGIGAVLEIAGLARAAGIVCSIGSNLELGVGTAAMLHVAATCATIDSETYPADIIGPLYHEADLITRPLTLGPAAAHLPDGPGLGVELDEEQLARWRQG
jgi:muconate cycloisomerase